MPDNLYTHPPAAPAVTRTAPRTMPDPPAETSADTAQLHGGRVLAYVLEHDRPAVWCLPDVHLERALSVSLLAVARADLLQAALDRITRARRLMTEELDQRRRLQLAREKAEKAADQARPTQPAGNQDDDQDDDSGRPARLQPRPRTNPPAGSMVGDIRF